MDLDGSILMLGVNHLGAHFFFSGERVGLGAGGVGGSGMSKKSQIHKSRWNHVGEGKKYDKHEVVFAASS